MVAAKRADLARGHGVHVLSRLALVLGLALHPLTAVAGPLRVQIDAAVHDDFRTVTGTITVDGEVVSLVDPLIGLPAPPDDRTLLRLSPGINRPHAITFERVGGNKWRFSAVLPRRYGDVGARRRGLFANGAWYPQPLVNGTLPVANWDVRVQLPDGAVGALGNEVSTGEVRWRGRAERAPLAVVRKGRVERRNYAGLDVTIVSKRTRRRFAKRAPEALLANAVGARQLPPVTIVEAPLRRRLARPGPGLLYLSDRAYRLSPGLRTYHDGAVTRGLVEAALPIADPFERSLAGAAAAAVAPAPSASGLLKWFSWNPVIDSVLNDRRLPFWADIFQAAHPQDPLRDDLVERFAPHGPTNALAAQLRAALGDDALRGLSDDLIGGIPLEESLQSQGIPPEVVLPWTRAYPEQDLRLDVSDGLATVVREAPADAGPEFVQLRVGKTMHGQLLEPGQAWSVPLEPGAKQVVVDPAGLVRQASRQGDAWPPRFIWLWAAWIDSFNLTERSVSGSATVWARGRDDTRNTWVLNASVNQQDLPSVTAAWAHRRGPLQDGLSRPHRFYVSATPAWTNARFSPDERSVFTVGGSVSYAWDTRVSALFPLRGRRLNVSLTGGVAPVDGTTWAALRVGASGVVSPHPRWAFAGRANVGVAQGDTTQRLLRIGGSGIGVSLAPGVAIGDLRGVAEGEVRWAPVRHASVPIIGLAWLSDIQVTAGAEAVRLRSLEGPWVQAVGVTGGVAFVTDLFGAKPGMIGVTAGIPAWIDGIDAKPWERPQVTLRFGQGF